MWFWYNKSHSTVGIAYIAKNLLNPLMTDDKNTILKGWYNAVLGIMSGCNFTANLHGIDYSLNLKEV